MKKLISDEFDDNYKNLYAAIYKQAVADDCREVRKKVKEALASKGADGRKVRLYMETVEPEIEALVCEAVYKEAQNFGGATRKMQREAITDIVDRVVNGFEG